SYGYGRVDVYRALKALAEPKSLPSPALLGWEGGQVKAADGEEVQAVLTVPPGAFNLPVYSGSTKSAMRFHLELVSSPPNFPQNIEPAGKAVYIRPWGESTVQKPLSLQLKLTPPQQQALPAYKESGTNSTEQIAYLYRWSGSRWLRVGGGLPFSASALEVKSYEPGLYRAGWSAAPATDRISGPDRISTALAIAREAFPTGADTVVLSRADSYPDALAGVPLAYRLQAPILLTNPQSLPQEVEQLITELAPRQIIILGGKSAVAPAVEERLRQQAPVTRLAGKNRYETASVIAHTLGVKGQAVVVSGSNFPDAITAASAAAQAGSPILLTPPGSLAVATANTLNRLSVVSTEVIGGTGVVNQSVWSKLPEPQRISGLDRYATSAAVVKAYQPQGDILYVATGQNFPDALTGGVLAAANSSAILLLPPQGLTAAQIQALHPLRGKKAVALGGRGAVSDQVLKQVQELIN
ncbi:MAG: cell wall-binding repeat-containing protein, partial [Clostridia bacterium]|nr:cell wall-binding repeat-containing protein [Clostridia bacterium]